MESFHNSRFGKLFFGEIRFIRQEPSAQLCILRLPLRPFPFNGTGQSQSVLDLHINRNYLFQTVVSLDFPVGFQRPHQQIAIVCQIHLPVVYRKIIPDSMHCLIRTQLDYPARFLQPGQPCFVCKKIIPAVYFRTPHRSCGIRYQRVKRKRFIFHQSPVNRIFSGGTFSHNIIDFSHNSLLLLLFLVIGEIQRRTDCLFPAL